MATAEKLKVISGGKADLGTKSWAEKQRKRARELIQMFDLGYMELAEILYNLFDVPINGAKDAKSWIQEWGYKGIGDFSEQELGLYRRKAEQLRAIWYRLEIELANLDPLVKTRILGLGWSKVRELIRVLTLRNAKKWVDLAETLSYHDLETTVSKYRQEVDAAKAAKETKAPSPAKTVEKAKAQADTDLPHAFKGAMQTKAPVVEEEEEEEIPIEDALPPPKNPDETTHQMRFAFYPEQLEIVKAALQRAQELSNSSVTSNNFALICQDFLATNTFKKADTDQIIRFLTKFEKLMGVRLVIIDKDDDPIYGITHLEEIEEKLGLGKDK